MGWDGMGWDGMGWDGIGERLSSIHVSASPPSHAPMTESHGA